MTEINEETNRSHKINLTVNLPDDKEVHYEINHKCSIGEVVGAAKLLNPQWTSIVAVITRR